MASVSPGVCAILTNAKRVPTWKKGGKFNWQHANEARSQSLHPTKTPNWVQRGGPQIGEVVLPEKRIVYQNANIKVFFRNIKESPNLAGLMTLNNLKVRKGESKAHN